MNYTEKFMEYANLIKRDGSNDFLAWLTNPAQSDFFTAPASTKYHSNFEGGLCEHTVKVFERLAAKKDDIVKLYPDLSEAEIMEKIAIVSLGHDISKANFYVKSTRNVKDEKTGKWEKVPCYKIEDKLPLGHTETSLYILQSFMKIKRDEAGAILKHMGDFEDMTTSQVYRMYPLALLLHVADMEATYLDETVVEE